jgi:Antibiotic biosynthesis monooxygenase
MFVFMTLHYPAPEAVEALAEGMAQMRGWMESQPGCLGVDPPLLTEDGTCLVGYSRWETKAALIATGLDLDALAETPGSELRPRQPYFLSSSTDAPA